MPSRRRVLQMLGAAGVIGGGGWALFGGTRANAYYQGPLSDHFDGVRFFNPGSGRPEGWAGIPALAIRRSRRVMAGSVPESIRRGPAARASRPAMACA